MIVVHACTCGKFAVKSLCVTSIWVAAQNRVGQVILIFLQHLPSSVNPWVLMSWDPWHVSCGRERSRSPPRDAVTVKSAFGTVTVKTPPWRVEPTTPPASEPTAESASQYWQGSHGWQEWYAPPTAEPAATSPVHKWQECHSQPAAEPAAPDTWQHVPSQAAYVSEVAPSDGSSWQQLPPVYGSVANDNDSQWQHMPSAQSKSNWQHVPTTHNTEAIESNVQSEPTGYELLHPPMVPDAVAPPPPPPPTPPPQPSLNAAQVKQHGGYRIKMAKLAWIVKYGSHPAVFDGWSAMQAAENVLSDSRISVDIEKVRMSVQKYRATPGVVAPGSV